MVRGLKTGRLKLGYFLDTAEADIVYVGRFQSPTFFVSFVCVGTVSIRAQCTPTNYGL